MPGESAGVVELAQVEARLTRAVALLWCDAMAVPFDPAKPHPSLAYQVAMEAVSYPALFDRLGITADDRAVAGEIAIEITTPAEIGQDYRVRSTLAPVEHKRGATIGAFEKVTVRSAARTWLPDHARCTPHTRPARNPNPGTPAHSSVALSCPGRPPHASRTHAPWWNGMCCGVRSCAHRPVKSSSSSASVGTGSAGSSSRTS